MCFCTLNELISPYQMKVGLTEAEVRLCHTLIKIFLHYLYAPLSALSFLPNLFPPVLSENRSQQENDLKHHYRKAENSFVFLPWSYLFSHKFMYVHSFLFTSFFSSIHQMKCCGWTGPGNWSENHLIMNSSRSLYPCSCRNETLPGTDIQEVGLCEHTSPQLPVYEKVQNSPKVFHAVSALRFKIIYLNFCLSIKAERSKHKLVSTCECILVMGNIILRVVVNSFKLWLLAS